MLSLSKVTLFQSGGRSRVKRNFPDRRAEAIALVKNSRADTTIILKRQLSYRRQDSAPTNPNQVVRMASTRLTYVSSVISIRGFASWEKANVSLCSDETIRKRPRSINHGQLLPGCEANVFINTDRNI